jgi:hypothetical protein
MRTRTVTGTLDELRALLPESEIEALERLLAEQAMQGGRPQRTYRYGRDSVVPKRLRWRVRCTGRRTNGEPCRAWAIHGGSVCWTHGGAAPQVRLAAMDRLEMDAWRQLLDRLPVESLQRAFRPETGGQVPDG